MKTLLKKLRLIIPITIILILLPGCLDIYFTTEIKANGDIVKTLVLEGDSSEIMGSYYPILHNETWEKEWIDIKTDDDEDKKKLVLSKTFKNYKLASADLNPADSLPYFRMEPKLKKKFRWFFTYFDYTDTVLEMNPFNKLDWKDFFSEEETELIVMDEEDREADPRYDKEKYSKVEDKFEEYILTSAFEELFQLFLKARSLTEGISLSSEDVHAAKAKLYQAALEAEENESIDVLMQIFQTVLDSKDVAKIAQDNSELLGYFDSKMEFFENAFDDNMHFTIRMPGLLISTNSNQIEGNDLTWGIDSIDAYFTGFAMKAESRIVNTWAFLVTGIALAFLLFYVIFNIFRRKKK